MSTTKETRFKSVFPVMFYLTKEDKKLLSDYAKKNKMNASQIAREGIRMRVDGNEYNAGFNAGLAEAMKITQLVEGAKMMFPSGKSFGDLVCEHIKQFTRGFDGK